LLPVARPPKNCTVAVDDALHSVAAAAGCTVRPCITDVPLTVMPSQPVAEADTRRTHDAEGTCSSVTAKPLAVPATCTVAPHGFTGAGQGGGLLTCVGRTGGQPGHSRSREAEALFNRSKFGALA
jgi:hypothetical protein